MKQDDTSARRAFLNHCTAVSAKLEHQSGDYLADHAERLYVTWRLCRRLGAEGRSFLSFGAGSAFVESALAADGVDITIVDFPEAIMSNAAHYEACGLRTVAADVSKVSPGALGQFDVVLAAEILEHVPMAPSQLIRAWSEPLRAGGRLILSTPNLGSVSTLLRIIAMRPLLPEPERAFGPVSFENEGVHRREYMPSEINSAFLASGLRPESITYSLNHRPRTLREHAFSAAQVIPRFRPTMILTAAK